MDTISLDLEHNTSISTSTPPTYGIIEPTRSDELRTISKVIVYHAPDQVPQPTRQPANKIVAKQLSLRSDNNSNILQPTKTPDTVPFALDEIYKSELIEINMHYENIMFFKQSNYFHTSIGTYAAPDGIICIPGRNISDPFQSSPEEELDELEYVHILTQGLICEMDQNIQDKVKFKTTDALVYYHERMNYLKTYKNSIKYSLYHFGDDFSLSAVNRNITVAAKILLNKDIATIIDQLEHLFKSKQRSNSLDPRNQQLFDSNASNVTSNLNNNNNNINNKEIGINTINVITGGSGSIKLDATNPSDPGPHQNNQTYSPFDNDAVLEEPEDWYSDSQATQDHTWQEYDDEYDYPATESPYRTPSFDFNMSDGLWAFPKQIDDDQDTEEKQPNISQNNESNASVLNASVRLDPVDTNNSSFQLFEEKTNEILGEFSDVFQYRKYNGITVLNKIRPDSQPRPITSYSLVNSIDRSLARNSDLHHTVSMMDMFDETFGSRWQNWRELSPDQFRRRLYHVNQYIGVSIARYMDLSPPLRTPPRYNESTSPDIDDIKYYEDTPSTRSDDINAIIDRNEQLLYGYESDSSNDSDLPDINVEQPPFIEDEIDDNGDEQEILQISSINAFENVKFVDTNLLFNMLEIGKGKQFISGASGYPPTTNMNINIQACRASYTCENMIFTNSIESTSSNELETIQLCTIEAPALTTTITTLSSNQSNQTKNALFTDHIKAYQNIDHSKLDTLETKCIKWWINVPVLLDNGQILQVSMMADTGANHPCVNYKWAFENFKDYIDAISKHDTILTTASEQLQPKYSLHLIFPLPNGIMLKTKFYLIKNLPCTILADINMLIKFGYTFKHNEKPSIFQHNEEPDENLHIKTFEDSHKIHEITSDLNQVSIALEEQPKLHESILVSDTSPMMNKSNQNTKPSILCITLQDYEFYKCNQDRYNNEYTINYINHDLSIAQDIWAPIAYEEELDQQLYIHGINVNTTQAQQKVLIKHKLGAEIETPVSNPINNTYRKYKTKSSFTSIAPINESHKESLVDDNSNQKQLLISQDTREKEDHAMWLLSEPINNLKAECNQNNLNYNENYNAVTNSAPTDSPTFNLNILNQNTSTKYYGTNLFSRLANKTFKQNFGRITPRKPQLTVTPTKQHYDINFIMMKESFKATEEELAAADELQSRKSLKPNNIDYIKEIEKMQPRLRGLFAKTTALIDEFDDIFAKHTYSRRTMKVKPARLGIIEKFRHITCFRAQYPLSVQKRLWMIEYTRENDINRYWSTVSRTLHCIPYLMIPKRNKNGEVIRYRPAFDASVVNQYLELYPIHLPTMRDFDEIYSIKGLFTLMDMKNMFDCIPLHPADRPWSTVMAPMGIRRMDHLAYGFKNCPYFAQSIMNKLAMHVGLTLVYIDDIVMKHHWHWNAQQHISHLRKIFEYIREKNMLLNPSKFYPFVTKCTSFGFERTFEGSGISDAYKQKIVQMKKPTTVRELREFQGTLNYVSRYLYNGSMMQYWLNQLMLDTPEKKGTLKWNKPAEIAFKQLKFLAANAPVLKNPTLDGEFMVKTDACMTGIGAVLYQNQVNPKTNKSEWVMVDMYHQMMPKDLRRAHSTVQEAYAVAKSLEHWQHYLMKRSFIMYTDNRPVAIVFTGDFEGLNRITQEKLIRLRVALAPFTFTIKHVPGVQNIIADALSRETIKIVKEIYGTDDTTHISKDEPSKDEYISFTAPVKSIDTRYKKQTPEQIKAINAEHAEITRHVNLVNQQLRNYEFKPVVSELAHNETLIAQNQPSDQIPVRVPNKSDVISQELDSSFDLLTHNWLKQQPFHLQQQIHDLLLSLKQNEAVITKDEYSNDEPMYSTMTEPLTNCVNICNKMSLPTLSEFADKQEHVYDIIQHKMDDLFQKMRGQKVGCIHSVLKNQLKNVKYVKNKSTNTKTHQSLPMTTRSQAKQEINQYQKKKSKSKKNSKSNQTKSKLNPKIFRVNQRQENQIRMQLRSDTRENHSKQAKRTEYLNEDFDDLTDRRLIRQEFIHNLYGHRTDKTLFNHDSFVARQKADTELQVIRSIIKRIENENCEINRNNIDTYEYYEADDETELTQQQLQTNSIIQDYESIQISNPLLISGIADGSLQIINDTVVKIQILDGTQYQSKVVPGILKHKLMDHAHHNIHSHHPNWEQSYNNIKCDYWWPTLKQDIRRFVTRCLLCNFANGQLSHRAPLTTREPVLPRESVFGDFIELTLANKRRYILVLVDYCTGWTMLLPTQTNDAYTVVDALIRKWIPLHGTFKYFDSDQGSGFISNVLKLLCVGLGTDLQFGEPGYHRGVGKVERTIRIIQSHFQRINLQWDEVITDCEDPNRSFNILRVITPHIQAALNQRRPRISTFSPNMLMFGTQLKDISNIDIVIERMRELFCEEDHIKYQSSNRKQTRQNKNNKNNNEYFKTAKYRTNPIITTVANATNQQTESNEQQNNHSAERSSLRRQSWINAWKNRKIKATNKKTRSQVNYKYEDYKYLERLLQSFKTIYKIYSNDWINYMYESKQQYNKRYKIDQNTIKRNNKIFKVGESVLYFVGDKQIANRKWLRRFTGPWTIVVKLSDGTVIIEDTKSKVQKRVSINRLKIFKQSEVNKYSHEYKDTDYDEYTKHLKDILFKVSEKNTTKSKTDGIELNYHKIRNNKNNVDTVSDGSSTDENEPIISKMFKSNNMQTKFKQKN